MTIVAFDSVKFKTRYPEFASVSDAKLSLCFDEAGMYLSNKDNSPVQDLTQRATLLNMLTAHIAFIGGSLSASGAANPVGRTSSATEGSVSASLEYLPVGTHAWFTQTQYGAEFWQATSSLRGFRYRSQPTRY